MITLYGAVIWSVLYALVCLFAWRIITGHIKVYLLILFNAIYLVGVFLLFLLSTP